MEEILKILNDIRGFVILTFVINYITLLILMFKK